MVITYRKNILMNGKIDRALSWTLTRTGRKYHLNISRTNTLTVKTLSESQTKVLTQKVNCWICGDKGRLIANLDGWSYIFSRKVYLTCQYNRPHQRRKFVSEKDQAGWVDLE